VRVIQQDTLKPLLRPVPRQRGPEGRVAQQIGNGPRRVEIAVVVQVIRVVWCASTTPAALVSVRR
jgi:hypothetical protein